jgi:hypothetical protein
MSTSLPQPNSNAGANSVLLIRVVTIAFTIAVSMFIWMAEFVLRPSGDATGESVFWVLAAMATATGSCALFMRIKTIPDLSSRIAAGEEAAWTRWRFSHMLGLAMSESVVLVGFVLRFLHEPRDRVLPFYIAGVLLVISFFPRRPEAGLSASHP